MFCKFLHCRLFAMHQKSRSDVLDAVAPRKELALIGVSRKAVDRMNMRTNRNVLIEQLNARRAVDNLTGGRADAGEADEYDRRLRSRQIVAQVMTHAAASAHPGASHNNRAAADLVDRNRVGALTG